MHPRLEGVFYSDRAPPARRCRANTHKMALSAARKLGESRWASRTRNHKSTVTLASVLTDIIRRAMVYTGVGIPEQ